jgi:uncharacterized RDD family membrane protein YckC
LIQFFIAWVVISLLWLWFTLVVAIFYPLIDGGLQQIWTIVRRKALDHEELGSGRMISSTEQVGVIAKA